MEKNQHNNSKATQQGDEPGLGRPGQELPAGAEQKSKPESNTTAQPERHSESSLPRQDGETLGTP